MRFGFLQSHAWQVSLGRFVILLATAFLIGLPWNAQLYTLLAATFGYSIWSLVTLYQVQSWLRSRKRRALAQAAPGRPAARIQGRCRGAAGRRARAHARPQRAVVQRSSRTTAR